MQTFDAEIDGLTQRFHIAGSGPTCIVHSGGPGIAWGYLRMPLLERRLTLVYVEPIGTGASARLADRRGYTIPRYALQILGILDHLGLRRAHLLGHSYGGFVAQHFAIDHPERLESLVLYATSPVTGPDFIASAARNIERISARTGDLRLREAFDAVWTAGDDATFTRLFREIFPAYFAEYAARAAEFEPLREGVVANWDPMCGESPGGPFDVRRELERVQVPTLVATGRHDYICGPSWAELALRALPHAASVTFDSSGHMPHLEEAALFADTIADFVTRHTPPTGGSSQ